MINKFYSKYKFNSFLPLLLVGVCLSFSSCALTDKTQIGIVSDSSGMKLTVDGKPYFVKGMNWDYFPIGTNYSYNLWEQPDEYIEKALEREMKLLKKLGVNTIRVYDGIPPKWIVYIYVNYSIRTIINHPFGRYGLTIDGKYIPNTDYSDRKTQVILLREIDRFAQKYKNVPGLLMWLVGNENNYGLFWEGAETENIPSDEKPEIARATAMYKLMNKAVRTIKKHDQLHPVAICNGDLLFFDILSKEVPDMDLLGVNAYRGETFTDLFIQAKEKLNKPVLLTEFGADAFNNIEMKEDQAMQAKYVLGNWKDIFLNAYGHGAGNVLGGMTFQFSDGWWKFDQEKNLDVHDSHASWSNGGYSEDFIPDENNMNEEWFGICAKGKTGADGFYILYPRAAYFAMLHALEINPLDKGVSDGLIINHFKKISIAKFVSEAEEYSKRLKHND